MEANKQDKSNILHATIKSVCDRSATRLLAAQKLERMAWKDSHMRETIMEHALGRICYELCGSYFRSMRNESLTMVADEQSAASGVRLVESTFTLLDFPLWDGTRLRDADKYKVLESAEKYEAQANTMMVRGLWLRSIAKKTPKDKKVGEVLTIEALQSLLDKAGGDE